MTTPADSAVEVLRSVEWGRGHRCPSCNGPEPLYWLHQMEQYGHKPECRLQAALTAPATAGQSDEVAELRAKVAELEKLLDDGGKCEIYHEQRADRAEAALAASEAKVELLREALKPFSIYAGCDAFAFTRQNAPDDLNELCFQFCRVAITTGDFRRARAALQADGGRKHG